MTLTLLKDRIFKVTRINLSINVRAAHFIPLLFFIFSCEKIPLSSENETGSIQFLIKIDNNNNTSVSPNQPSALSKLNTVSTVQISLSGPQSTEVTLNLSGNSVSHTIEDLVEGSYSVKVSLKNSKGTLLYQQSKTVEVSAGATANPTFNNFTASNLSLYVSSPSGSLSFTDGQTISIDWDASHPAEPVKIQLMRSNSAISTISASTKSSPLSWTIPSNLTTSNKYNVKLSYVSQPDVSANSNDFAIKFPIWTEDFSDLTVFSQTLSTGSASDFSISNGKLVATGANDSGSQYAHRLGTSPVSLSWWASGNYHYLSNWEYSVEIDFTNTSGSDDWGYHGIYVVHQVDNNDGSATNVEEYYIFVGETGSGIGVMSYDRVSRTWGDWDHWISNSSALSSRKGLVRIKYDGTKLMFYFNDSKIHELNPGYKFQCAQLGIYHQNKGIVYYDNAKLFNVSW